MERGLLLKGRNEMREKDGERTGKRGSRAENDGSGQGWKRQDIMQGENEVFLLEFTGTGEILPVCFYLI